MHTDDFVLPYFAQGVVSIHRYIEYMVHRVSYIQAITGSVSPEGRQDQDQDRRSTEEAKMLRAQGPGLKGTPDVFVSSFVFIFSERQVAKVRMRGRR